MKKIIRVNEKFYSVDTEAKIYEQVENIIDTDREQVIIKFILEHPYTFCSNGINQER